MKGKACFSAIFQNDPNDQSFFFYTLANFSNFGTHPSAAAGGMVDWYFEF